MIKYRVKVLSIKYKWQKEIIIKRMVLKYYALNRIYSRKFLISNRYDESTNNVSSRFAFAHRNFNMEGEYVRQFDKTKHVWTQIIFLGKDQIS